jgi:hypothetical protein
MFLIVLFVDEDFLLGEWEAFLLWDKRVPSSFCSIVHCCYDEYYVSFESARNSFLARYKF